MAQKNRTCLSCATKYSYCPDCSGVDKLNPWKANFCSEPCKTMWETLTRFNMGRVSKSEAKDIISALDLKPIDTYVVCVQRDYAKVMVEEKRPRRIHKIIEPVVQQVIADTVQVTDEAIHEVVETNENA